MTRQDLDALISPSDPVLYHRVAERLAVGDRELLSLFWLLREGVVGQGTFRSLVAGSVAR